MKTKAKKLGQTDFIGSPEALRKKAHEKVLSYKKGMAKIKKMKKQMKSERLAKIKSVKVKYL